MQSGVFRGSQLVVSWHRQSLLVPVCFGLFPRLMYIFCHNLVGTFMLQHTIMQHCSRTDHFCAASIIYSIYRTFRQVTLIK